MISSETIIGLVILTLLFPGLSALLTWLMTGQASARVSTLLSGLGAICALLLLLLFPGDAVDVGYPWFNIGGHPVAASLLIDSQSVTMATVVMLISFSVHLYSIGYMAKEAALNRYYSLLSAFSFAMMGLVFSGNLMILFVCWELVGLTSFLLIGFWRDRPGVGPASVLAFVTNRIGDVALLSGMILVWLQYGTLEITGLAGSQTGTTTLTGILLFGGVMAKSAQFPLFTWLPHAMVGPTPVSALIHAATMVAAGVYLLIRVDFLFNTNAIAFIAPVGMITALIGGLGALIESDIKKILAFSTLSQLGLMVMTFGAGGQGVILPHLVSHAFFKAVLFLLAGILIHETTHNNPTSASQDIRNLSIRSQSLWIKAALLISAGSLAGLPLTASFLSKEGMLEALPSGFYQIAFLIISLLTSLYAARLVVVLFKQPGNETEMTTIDPALTTMKSAVLSLVPGCAWLVHGATPIHSVSWLMLVSLSIVLTGLGIGFVVFSRTSLILPRLSANFGFDLFNQVIVARLVFPLAQLANNADRIIIDRNLDRLARWQVAFAYFVAWIDREWIDGIVRFVGQAAQVGGILVRSFHKGKIQLYIFWTIASLLIFITWWIL